MSSFIEDTQYLLSVDFVQSSLIASALLGILSGVMTSLIVLRQMSFPSTRLPSSRSWVPPPHYFSVST